MLIKLDVANYDTAKKMIDIQIPAYKVEAELIGYDGIPQLQDTVETMMQCREKFVGYLLGGELVAFISYEETEQEVEICRLVVHPYHFRKKIATILVEHIVETISQGRSIRVNTGALNFPAKGLYQMFGFRQVKDIEVAPGVFITELRRN
ncbi:GNAT family N-acetyltransferase [Paenibacillus woosongensis]|uniref:N-acetyltransferase n=2 Tax=Paenibacillus woosongensis TaxID=307580 RepID=A0AA95I9M2_9BACL|nr:GNAT family N-acetyltransferase [Paenibacillus woosongensis]WHX48335.1 GNAT family N-acetyltransferase [Paenibacillus woosongensis]GIP59958.1 N-acetyltransferase [Paenibacillus woosongensis]